MLRYGSLFPQDDNNEDDDEQFRVFLGHGRNQLYIQVARFIERELDVDTVILEEQANRGRTIIEKLEDETDNCHYAIIIVTAEDEQASGQMRARQNVIHEIGFCQGKFGRENVLVLRQDTVEEFSNISGIVYEPFQGDNIASTHERIRQELRHAMDGFDRELAEDI